MLSFHQVCAGYGKTLVLDRIDFSLAPHAMTAVVGRNGSGKSTLVSCVNRKLPYTGEISFSGRSLASMTSPGAGKADRHPAADASFTCGHRGGTGGFRAESLSGFRQTVVSEGQAACS